MRDINERAHDFARRMRATIANHEAGRECTDFGDHGEDIVEAIELIEELTKSRRDYRDHVRRFRGLLVSEATAFRGLASIVGSTPAAKRLVQAAAAVEQTVRESLHLFPDLGDRP